MDRCKDCSNWVSYGSLYPKNTASEAKRAGGLCSSEKLGRMGAATKCSRCLPEAPGCPRG